MVWSQYVRGRYAAVDKTVWGTSGVCVDCGLWLCGDKAVWGQPCTCIYCGKGLLWVSGEDAELDSRKSNTSGRTLAAWSGDSDSECGRRTLVLFDWQLQVWSAQWRVVKYQYWRQRDSIYCGWRGNDYRRQKYRGHGQGAKPLWDVRLWCKSACVWCDAGFPYRFAVRILKGHSSLYGVLSDSRYELDTFDCSAGRWFSGNADLVGCA